MAKKKHYLIKGEKYSIDDTFKIIAPLLNPDEEYNKDNRPTKVNFYGDMIKPNSQRYQTFYYKGCTCVKCGRKALYFEKNKMSNDRSYHLNLYGMDENGNEVLFTKDHILPKSKGGQDYITNYQTMCEKCNKEKLTTMSRKDKIHTLLASNKLCRKFMVTCYKKYPAYKLNKWREKYENN